MYSKRKTKTRRKTRYRKQRRKRQTKKNGKKRRGGGWMQGAINLVRGTPEQRAAKAEEKQKRKAEEAEEKNIRDAAKYIADLYINASNAGGMSKFMIHLHQSDIRGYVEDISKKYKIDTTVIQQVFDDLNREYNPVFHNGKKVVRPSINELIEQIETKINEAK